MVRSTTASTSSTLIDEYISFYNENVKKYGERVLILMEVGAFFEIYGDTSNFKGFLDEIGDNVDIRIQPKNDKRPYRCAGFPNYALESWISRFLELKFVCVVVEQVKNSGASSSSSSKMTRQQTAVYTTGNYITSTNKYSNYILNLYIETHRKTVATSSAFIDDTSFSQNYQLSIGACCIDVTTGKCVLFESHDIKTSNNTALEEIYRFKNIYSPKEVVVWTHQSLPFLPFIERYLELPLGSTRYRFENDVEFIKNAASPRFQKKYLGKYYDSGAVDVLDYLELNTVHATHATTALILSFQYCFEQNPDFLKNISKPIIFTSADNSHLKLTTNTIQQLAVYTTATTKDKSLFQLIDFTLTPMGTRRLLENLLHPITSISELNRRYDIIETLQDKYTTFQTLLLNIPDIERLHQKMNFGKVTIPEFISLHQSYNKILTLLQEWSKLFPVNTLSEKLIDFQNYYLKIIWTEGLLQNDGLINNIFHSNINPEMNKRIKEYQKLIEYFDVLCAELSKISVATGPSTISTTTTTTSKKNHVEYTFTQEFKLKISITAIRFKLLEKTFTTPLKVSIPGLGDFEYTYDSFQTEKKQRDDVIYLTNTQIAKFATRLEFLIPEIKNEIAEEFKKFQIQIFNSKHFHHLREITDMVADIDAYVSAAKCSTIYKYCRPAIIIQSHNDKEAGARDGAFLKAKNLRHPIIERLDITTEYIPISEIEIGCGTKQDGMIIFGLNSSGKSSLLKSIGLSVILAQSGMFVPASEFLYNPFHDIFTRIVGEDNLYKGLSAYAVELSELRPILDRSDSFSLVLADEVCHSTESQSAIALLSASIITLAKNNTPFITATHFHEIADLQRIKDLDRVNSYHFEMEVKDILDVSTNELITKIIYNRKLAPGSGNKNYGLLVAKALKISPHVLDLAEEIRKEILKEEKYVLQTKPSRYNSSVLLDKCEICLKEKAVETHHIQEQKYADENDMIDIIHKDTASNLIGLCEKCHLDTHHKKIKINGWKMSTTGRVLDIEKNLN
jgi:DNA mismatch repair protein MutS